MKMKSNLRHTLIALAALTTVHSPAFAQGSLTPPPGAPAPTMKTLEQIEPRIPIGPDTTPGDNDATPSCFKITQPGSYYLTSNLTGQAGRFVIEITAPGVTLDLNGFEIVGGAGSLTGIYANGDRASVRNGTIRNCGQNGVLLQGADVTIERVTSTANTNTGIFASLGARVAHCTASSNGTSGIIMGEASVGIGLIARANGNVGIAVGTRGVLTDSVSSLNGGTGITTGANARINNATANQNGGQGMSLSSGSLAAGCTASANALSGFQVPFGAKVMNCIARANGLHGISLEGYGGGATGNNVMENGISPNTPGAGINVTGSGCEVAGNTCFGNRIGIQVAQTGSTIRDNTCANSSIDGILVTSSHNRLEGNHLIHNGQTGLRVTGEYNLIIRNTARNGAVGAVNWNIAQFNRAGAYVAPANNAAINGATGGNGSGTTDPFANLSF